MLYPIELWVLTEENFKFSPQNTASANYYARVRFKSKLICKSLKTGQLAMAKPHIGDFLKEEGHRVEITQAAAAAGTAIPKKFEEARLEEIDRVIDVICFRLAGSAWQEGPIGIFEEI